MSNMYSLLNYIAATTPDILEGSGSKLSSYIHSQENATTYSVETGLRGCTEEEKRLIGISTITVVTRLALEFQTDEVHSISRILS